MKRFLFAVAVAAAPLLGAADEEVRVCPECGVEAASATALFCASCGAALDGELRRSAPPPPPQEPDPAGAAPGGDPARKGGEKEGAGAFDPAAAVAAVAAADASAAKTGGRGDAFSVAAMNDTLKASRLFPGALAADAVAKLQAAKAAAMARLAAPRVEKCPICGGAKKVAVAAEKASRAKSNSGVRRIEDEAVSKTSPQSSAQCRFCRGLGRLARVRDREAVAEDLRLGTAAFSRLAEADGRCKALGVWWKAADAVALKAAKGSSASRAANDREDECRKCSGIGTVRCPECSGWGRVRCKAAVHGAAGHSGNAGGDSTIEASLLGSSEAASARCRECGGKASDAGFTSCGACGGRGFAACRACDGSGRSR